MKKAYILMAHYVTEWGKYGNEVCEIVFLSKKAAENHISIFREKIRKEDKAAESLWRTVDLIETVELELNSKKE